MRRYESEPPVVKQPEGASNWEVLKHFKSKDFEVLEDFCELLGPIGSTAYFELDADLKAGHGPRDPLIVGTWKEEDKTRHVLLDGHNRLRICIERGLMFGTTTIEFGSALDAKIWAIKNQVGRRNLTTGQQAYLAADLKGFYAEKGKINKRLAGKKTQEKRRTEADPEVLMNSSKAEEDDGFEAVNARREAARVIGVSEASVAQAEFVREKGTLEDQKAVVEGKLSLNKAFQRAKGVSDERSPGKPRVEPPSLRSRARAILEALSPYAPECPACGAPVQIPVSEELIQAVQVILKKGA